MKHNLDVDPADLISAANALELSLLVGSDQDYKNILPRYREQLQRTYNGELIPYIRALALCTETWQP